MKFKAGDRVITSNQSNPIGFAGKSGVITVVREETNMYPYFVEFDNSDGGYIYKAEELKLLEQQDDNGLIDKQEHYTNNGIQPIEIMKENMTTAEYRGFLLGNIIKYPLRYKDKNGLEDLKKALTYLTWLIEDVEEKGL